MHKSANIVQRPAARTLPLPTRRGLHKSVGKQVSLDTRVLETSPTPSVPAPTAYDYSDYIVDIWQRSILFWDAIRQRADNMLEHERTGLPPLLQFKYETILDARQFETPANYALLRITEIGEDCTSVCVDSGKAPVIVIDPRAGHGPGIGGFKRESEVGLALHEGYPIYFVMFFPEPVRGQTLEDVRGVLRRFVEEVARRHDGKAPVLYGNCQAGWAVALLAADCEGLAGPTVLNGSPLSYWAGESGVNPLRVAGGLLGGVWLTHFLADIGHGRFDGAWLAQTFEALKPEKAIWQKYADFFSRIDTERERFLEFERWWNGFYFLSREEMIAIVENLFIGNQLEQGELRIDEGCTADLRRIRNPLVIFASYGDDISPPHQALAWIPVVYRDTDDLKRARQRIVYLTNPHIGHLGIFVSAKVARFEHRAILGGLKEIEALKPGLYEMKIGDPKGNMDGQELEYAVRFEERQVEDIKCPRESAAFERVRDLSEVNEAYYRAFMSPWVQAATNPWTAEALKWLHPMRLSRYAFSEAFNPWMRGLAVLADSISRNQDPLPENHPLIEMERNHIGQFFEAIEGTRRIRDSGYELAFRMRYGGSDEGSIEE